MRRDIQLLLVVFLVLPLTAVAASRPGSRPTLIVPGERLGPVDASSSLAGLRVTCGARNVAAQNVLAEDGTHLPGAVIYPGDPGRRIEVAWADTAGRRRPRWARARGAASVWRTPGGVGLGTTLVELEKLNGRAFTIWGFGAEHGGQVRSWNNGALAVEMRRNTSVSLRLPSRATAREVAAVSQGEIFPSGDPVLRRLNPSVGEIVMSFDSAGSR